MSLEAQASGPTPKIARLKDRGQMLARSRQFFSDRGILEVDVPMCTVHACIDENIDLMTVHGNLGPPRYLQSSPEYGMKRLLAEGSGDIFQIGHVFRDSEVGAKHNPEFTMVEWYRCGFTFEQMVHETADFVRLFLGDQKLTLLTYREAFRQFAGIDCFQSSKNALLHCLRSHGIELSAALEHESSIDDLLNLLMGSVIENHLGNDGLTALIDFPATQSALAETVPSEGVQVAKRFEIFYESKELANGYLELRDSAEQLQRLHRSNTLRESKGKGSLPVDPFFLKALESGLPSCCGVAVGFDRLMMLRHRSEHIKEIIPFCWDEA